MTRTRKSVDWYRGVIPRQWCNDCGWKSRTQATPSWWPLFTQATLSLCPYTPKLLRHYAPIHAENIQMFRIGNILFFAHFCRAYATSQNTLFCILNLKMNWISLLIRHLMHYDNTYNAPPPSHKDELNIIVNQTPNALWQHV